MMSTSLTSGLSNLASVTKPGHNLAPPYAQEVTNRMAADYAALVESAVEAIQQADELPLAVENSEQVALISAAVVKIRDIKGRTESHRKAEKEPYLRSAEAIDAFFFRLEDQLEQVRKELATRVDTFKQRQLAEERARRAAEAADARRVQEQALLAQAQAVAAQRRARSAEMQAQREAEASRARIDAQMAEEATERAVLSEMASPTAMVGERFEGRERSGQVAMRKTPVVFIEDVSKLDLELLRPFIKEEHLLMALRGWAKATGYSQEMPGATVAMRDSTIIK
jgi:hypothetical protein